MKSQLFDGTGKPPETLLGCLVEELVMLGVRWRLGEPLRCGAILSSAWHHWKWAREYYRRRAS